MLCLLPACLPACHCCATLIIHTRHSDAGCAAVFLPFWRDCQTVLATQSASLLPVVSLCKARVASDAADAAALRVGYQCSCVGGWGGAKCDEPSSCDGDPCGAHGTCVAVLGRWNHCQCKTGWGGVTCGDLLSYGPGFGRVASSIVGANVTGLALVEGWLPEGAPRPCPSCSAAFSLPSPPAAATMFQSDLAADSAVAQIHINDSSSISP